MEITSVNLHSGRPMPYAYDVVLEAGPGDMIPETPYHRFLLIVPRKDCPQDVNGVARYDATEHSHIREV